MPTLETREETLRFRLEEKKTEAVWSSGPLVRPDAHARDQGRSASLRVGEEEDGSRPKPQTRWTGLMSTPETREEALRCGLEKKRTEAVPSPKPAGQAWNQARWRERPQGQT